MTKRRGKKKKKKNQYTEESHPPTIMCKADVTGSLVPTVAKQMQSVEPVDDT